jgi:hypothetical protein
MAYKRGDSAKIIVGAAALFTYEVSGDASELSENDLPDVEPGVTYRDTLELNPDFRNVGYTMNGLELVFQPDFGEVQVDQLLDVAKLYKQGMQVNLNTAFAEATLENLLFSLAGKNDDLGTGDSESFAPGASVMSLSAGDIGECAVERGMVAVGPGTGDCAIGDTIERIYVAYRALSIESVTVAARRDEPTMYEVSFRLLPNDDASYGQIVDRTIPLGS